MKSVRDTSEKKSYRVFLLLIVGLTAFSSAMKELNLLREFTRDTNNIVARWSQELAPKAPEVVVPSQVPQAVEKVEVCESHHTLESAEPVKDVQLGGGVARAEVKIKEVGKTVVAERSRHRDTQIVARLRAGRSADIDLSELRKHIPSEADLKVMIMAGSDGEGRVAVPTNLEFKVPKVKSLNRHFVIKPEDREMLKNLNRSLNLRSAG